MITMNELFSGIGAQSAALKRLGLEFSVTGISDIDKYANQSYYAIHGQTRQYGDISKIDHLDYADLWTYSFPCQDLSVAGKQAGITENSRSGLLFQVERLLERAVQDGTQPKYLLLENVKNLVGKKFFPDFQRWLNKLDELGYRNYWKVLNAKNYGVPQNRERVFVVSIRKDINQTYEFPKEIPLTKRLKDVLETNVDEKYYLSEDKVARFIKSTELSKYPFGQEYKVLGSTSETPERDTTNSRQWVMDANTVSPTLDATQYKTPKQFVEPQVKQVGNIVNTGNWENPQRGRIYDSNGCSPALNTMQGGGLEPKVIVKYDNLRIRKLTPKETWRLMGFTDEEFEKAKYSGVSNSQLYKQAGNSIVVNVLEAIFRNLFINKTEQAQGELKS